MQKTPSKNPALAETDLATLTVAELLQRLDRGVMSAMKSETAPSKDFAALHRGREYRLYGPEFTLDDYKREQLLIVATIVRKILESGKDARWLRLQKLIAEGGKKGFFTKLQFPVYWLTNSGSDTTDVHKVLIEDPKKPGVKVPGIEVPKDIYAIYYWDERASQLIVEAKTSNENTIGQSVQCLNEILVDLSSFFHQAKLIQ